MAVLELSDAKKYLNIQGEASDAELNAMIAGAVAAIEGRVGPLEAVEVTDRIEPYPGYAGLVLSTMPVLSITSVTPNVGTALDVDDLYVDDGSGLLTYAAASTRFPGRSYTVVYQAGRNPVPGDLKLAVKELLRHLWATQRGTSRSSRPASPQSEAVANTMPGAAFTFPIRVTQLIEPHLLMPGFA